MGFGHRVYKNYDPRAKIIKQVADEVFEVTGTNPLLDIALELERIALEDEYFVKRKLYPNVDFYSGIIYQAMGFPVDMFPVLFAIPRTSGWLAQWEEMMRDPEQNSRGRGRCTLDPFSGTSRRGWSAHDRVTWQARGAAVGRAPACSRSSVFAAAASPQPPAPASSPQPPALIALLDRHQLPRLDRAADGVGPVRPAHDDLVDAVSALPEAEVRRAGRACSGTSPPRRRPGTAGGPPP